MSKDKVTLENPQEVREFIADTLQRLVNREIEVEEASCIQKLTEAMTASLKHELEYARLLGKEPNIPFLKNSVGSKNLLRREKDITPKNKQKYLSSK